MMPRTVRPWRLALVAPAIAALLLVAACDDEDTSGTGESTPVTETALPTGAATAEGLGDRTAEPGDQTPEGNQGGEETQEAEQAATSQAEDEAEDATEEAEEAEERATDEAEDADD